MRVIIEADAQAASLRAAAMISQLVSRKPDCVLGLATGGTPLPTYQELIRRHREENLDFSRVTTFNLDEYVGLPPSHPQSYRWFMQTNLFSQLNIPPSQTNVPDGRAFDYASYCQQYERKIADCGGIDLQLLGIGTDGHIAFNEPGSSLGSRTRLKSLTSETIRDNARYFDSEADVPRLSVTMGVGTILESRKCILLAFGAGKAAAVAAMIEGPLTSQITASALQMHPDAIAILDEPAAEQLQRREYYQEVEEAQQLLEAGQFSQLGLPTSDG